MIHKSMLRRAFIRSATIEDANGLSRSSEHNERSSSGKSNQTLCGWLRIRERWAQVLCSLLSLSRRMKGWRQWINWKLADTSVFCILTIWQPPVVSFRRLWDCPWSVIKAGQRYFRLPREDSWEQWTAAVVLAGLPAGMVSLRVWLCAISMIC